MLSTWSDCSVSLLVTACRIELQVLPNKKLFIEDWNLRQLFFTLHVISVTMKNYWISIGVIGVGNVYLFGTWWCHGWSQTFILWEDLEAKKLLGYTTGTLVEKRLSCDVNLFNELLIIIINVLSIRGVHLNFDASTSVNQFCLHLLVRVDYKLVVVNSVV